MPNEMNLREYVDMRINSRKETIDEQFNATTIRLTEVADNLRNGLSKAEHALQISLDRVQNELRLSQIDAEKRVNEKLEEREKALTKASEVMDERLDQMNKFRDQINAERSLYVTRDLLESNLKGVHDQITIMTRTITLSSGKTEGVSSVGSIVLNVLVGVSALMSGISTFLVISHLFK